MRIANIWIYWEYPPSLTWRPQINISGIAGSGGPEPKLTNNPPSPSPLFANYRKLRTKIHIQLPSARITVKIWLCFTKIPGEGTLCLFVVFCRNFLPWVWNDEGKQSRGSASCQPPLFCRRPNWSVMVLQGRRHQHKYTPSRTNTWSPFLQYVNKSTKAKVSDMGKKDQRRNTINHIRQKNCH